MQGGFLKIDRSKMLGFEWYTDVNVCHLFQHFLLRANHSENKWQGTTISRGQLISSLEHLSAETGLSVRNIRTAIGKLKDSNYIETKATSSFSIITICNYDSWIGEKEKSDTPTDTPTDKRPTSDRQASDNKQECKECKEEKEYISKENLKRKKFVKPELNDCAEYATLQGWQWDVSTFYDYYESKGWLVGKSPMKDWRAAMRNWNKNENNRRQYGGNQDKQSERISQFAENTWNFINKNKC